MSGNSRQRRTLARAKDALRPYGVAVERERRKRKKIHSLIRWATDGKMVERMLLRHETHDGEAVML